LITLLIEPDRFLNNIRYQTLSEIFRPFADLPGTTEMCHNLPQKENGNTS
jgi:hypothetical protein